MSDINLKNDICMRNEHAVRLSGLVLAGLNPADCVVL